MTTPTRVDIGSLIYSDPEFRGGRPCIAGTGMSVHNIAARYIRGDTADEIADDFPDVPRSHIMAALAYYFANKDEIEGYLAAENELYDVGSRLNSLARMLTGQVRRL